MEDVMNSEIYQVNDSDTSNWSFLAVILSVGIGSIALLFLFPWLSNFF